LEVGLANGCFLRHAPKLLVEASIELAAQLASSRGPCHGVVEAA
jgi:hypothetical protein